MSFKDEIKGAIIGFGHIAANGHVPAYKKNPRFKICAVFDKCPDREKINQELLPGSRFYSCVDDLFKEEQIDFIDIATPPALHATYILEALKNKKHVLCEKPLVLKPEELKQIWQGIKDTGCTVVTVHNWRYSPITQKISHIMASGDIGKAKEVEYTVIRTKPSVAVGEEKPELNWRLDPSIAGGGILVDHGWHAFYLINEWVGNTPQKIECRLENRKFKNISVEDTATVEVTYFDNTKARLFFTWAGNKRQNKIVIKAENGILSCLDDRIIVENGKKDYQITFEEGLSAGSHHPEWYHMVLNEFFNELTNKNKRTNNFKEAATCFNMLFYSKKAHVEKRPLEMKKWQDIN